MKFIEQFAYSGALYKDARKYREEKKGQPHSVAGAQLDELNNYLPLNQHISKNVNSSASAISCWCLSVIIV